MEAPDFTSESSMESCEESWSTPKPCYPGSCWVLYIPHTTAGKSMEHKRQLRDTLQS